jgi:hypothetical protein
MTTWYEQLLLVRPEQVQANLHRACDSLALPTPTTWQMCLGVLRMWHRVAFRSETVGTSSGTVRPTWRARALAWRAIRLPFLLGEGAVVPLDFTGLGSPPARLIRHLLGAHHDANQFVYDLELLAAYGRLDELLARVRAVVERDDARSRWLRDLAVFDGYHEALLAAVEHAIASGPAMSDDEASDPDISLRAYLQWCGQQPPTPRATLDAWRNGTLRLDSRLSRRDSPVPTIAEIRAMSGAALAETMASGRAVDPSTVEGWVYRGTSLGLPRWIERLTWTKFAKAFHRDPGASHVRGWNIRIEQDELDRPWRPRMRRGRSVTFGKFTVRESTGGVVLDYGTNGGVLGALRDPLFSLDARGDVLIGRSLVQLGPASIPTPSYFLLERDQRIVDPLAS